MIKLHPMFIYSRKQNTGPEITEFIVCKTNAIEMSGSTKLSDITPPFYRGGMEGIALLIPLCHPDSNVKTIIEIKNTS